ncbi:MAG: fibronectin type III domain-containing protein [Candidatus Peribacteraceae bacterium]|nr:fibronectin type III domain-containing protein [Candidatus Peribacteraceae bacterium]MDD5074281.1 fibronectin type III domain-containing protein [Candidatus Peribacteraceae bacterium]
MKKPTALTALLTLAVFLIPSPVLSAGMIVAHDTVAGIGTTVEGSGFEPNASVRLALAPPLGPDVPLEATADARGDVVIHITGTETQIAGTYDIMQDGGGKQLSFEVSPDSIDPRSSSIETDRVTLSPDGKDAVRATVFLRDRYLNPLAGRPVKLISSRTEDRIEAASAETDEDGRLTFRVSTNKSGSLSLRAMDLLSGKLLDDQATLTAQDESFGQGGYDYVDEPQTFYAPQQSDWTAPQATENDVIPVGQINGRTLYGQLVNTFGAADHFRIQIDGMPTKSGPVTVPIRQDMSFRVFVEDKEGKTVEDYTGSVRFSSTDPKAILPFGTRQFTLRDLGAKTFTLGLRFNTPGEQTVAVEDASGQVKGSLTVTIPGTTAQEGDIRITDPKEGATINTPTILLKGKAPPLINLIVTGGKEIARGESGSNGDFQISVDLSPEGSGAVLRVEEAAGKFRSNDLTLSVDIAPPKISSIEYNPSEPMEGENIRVTVKSEVNLPAVTVTIGSDQSPLIEDPARPGMYEGSFTAPMAGTYQPAITAFDRPGNKSEILSNLIVKPKSPPKVTNVTAEAKVNAIALKWNAVPQGDADAYRVYVGDKADNFTYSLDTERAISAATVSGLKPGTTYFFTVTALKMGVESVEKSEVINATVLGITLAVVPGDQSLTLTWEPLQRDTPLASYILEYGSEPDHFTEKRMISGEAKTYTLRDLLNGIAYYVKLTPVTTTGELLKDLATTGDGTPNGEGFGTDSGHGAATDYPPPVWPPVGTTHNPTTPTGPDFSLIILWLAIGGAIVGIYWHWQRRRTLSTTAAFLQAMEHRYHR